jgi:hypothetical protein
MVVAGLHAADHAGHVGGHGQRRIVGEAGDAVADVAADIETGPLMHRRIFDGSGSGLRLCGARCR